MMQDKIISIKSLSFRYKKKDELVLDNINLSIRKGEIFGLLGPNGAGKTTLIHILSTLLNSSKGEVWVDSTNINDKPGLVRQKISVLFQETILDEELSSYQNMDFYARLYNLPNKDKNKRIKRLLGFVGLKDAAHKKVETYSGGMKRKLEIARCLINKPEILLLDEPTLGLDPLIRRQIWEYIKNLKKQGITVVVTTNYIDEAEFLCDRVAILNKGKIVVVDSITKLKNKVLPHKSNFRVKVSLEEVFLNHINESNHINKE